MNPPLKLAALALLFSTLDAQLSTASAQGTLTPPGAPAPTMKSLDQIEPRTPISSAPFTITNPGSYYLTTNITVTSGDAITIATNGVTLDLNGFTISSTAPSAAGYGILLNGGLRNIKLANGFIKGGVTNNGSGVYSGSGFGYGIDFSGIAPVNVLVSRIAVSGCLYSGIRLQLGVSTVVESCTVRTVGGYGIAASTIKQSLATDCGYIAIYGDQVSDSRGVSTGSGNGVYAATAQNCYGFSSSSEGVYATSAQNCYGSSINGTGVYATTAQNCFGYSNGTGVNATTAQNCYGSSSAGGFGVYASHIAIGCFGSSGSGTGLNALTAQSCYGESQGSGTGVYAGHVAIGCSGYSASGTGVNAFIANVCHGQTSTGTALATSHNVNSF